MLSLCGLVSAAWAQPAAKAEVDARGVPLVSNVFQDTNIREALADVAGQTETIIVVDETVQGLISLELRSQPLDKALDLLLLASGAVWDEIEKGVYLVTTPDPKLRSFQRICQTEVISPRNRAADELVKALPPSLEPMVRADAAGNRLIISAPRRMLADVVAAVSRLDTARAITVAPVPATIDLRHLSGPDLRALLPERLANLVRATPGESRISVQATPEDMAAIVEQIKQLDVARTDYRVVLLTRMTAAAALALLPDTWRGYVKGEPDGRRLLVQAPADRLPQVIDYIAKLDDTTTLPVTETRVVPLRYLDSKELTSLLPTAYVTAVKVDDSGRRASINADPLVAAQIQKYIEGLDTAPRQIMIEALVVESDAGALDNLGLKGSGSNYGGDAAAGLLTYVQAAEKVFVELLLQVQRKVASIKASPRVVAQEGKESTIKVAINQYFRMVTSRQSYDYVEMQAIESGISLTIQPKVAAEDGAITCKLTPEVGDVTATTSDKLPVVTTRSATTTVRVKDGEMIAIGGMVEEVETDTKTKIPLLGDLPLIGSLFQSRNREKRQREVTIFVVPHLLDESGSYKGQLLMDRFETLRAAELAAAKAAKSAVVVKPAPVGPTPPPTPAPAPPPVAATGAPGMITTRPSL